ncbi:kinase-like protein [Xylariaceae sp. AK1471]|nr:kinase-like protein [Xylariaceae sp. AK1471]
MVFTRKRVGYEDPHDEVEELSHYAPGGFHPIHIGDIFIERLEVIHKLGYGDYATVWLCWDKRKRKWVAVKIIQAAQSHEDRPEVRLIKSLKEDASFDPTEWEKAGIILPFEQFWLEGPNGRHLCEVLPVLGPTLKDRWNYGMGSNKLPMLKELLFQTGSALQFLHQKGICHGDFRPHNILLRVQDITYMEKDELIELIGMPQLLPLEPREGAPRYAVIPARLDRLEIKNEVALIGFSECFYPSEVPAFHGIPIQYGAPEVVFHCQPSFPSDVWSLACTLFEIRVGRRLFSRVEEEQDYVLALEEMLGPLPQPYRTVYINQRKKHKETVGDAWWGHIPSDGPTNGEDGQLELASDPESFSILREHMEETGERLGYTDRFRILIAKKEEEEEYYEARLPKPECMPSDREVRVLAHLLSKIIKWDPEERISLDTVLKHGWFTDRESQAENEPTRAPPVRAGRTATQEQPRCSNRGESNKHAAIFDCTDEITPRRDIFDKRLSKDTILNFTISFLLASIIALLYAFFFLSRNYSAAHHAHGTQISCSHAVLVVASTVRSSTSTYSQGLIGFVENWTENMGQRVG